MQNECEKETKWNSFWLLFFFLHKWEILHSYYEFLRAINLIILLSGSIWLYSLECRLTLNWKEPSVHDMSTSLTIISISPQRPKWASFCLCFFSSNEEWWSGKENKQQEDDKKKARERERRRDRHRTSLALSLVTEGLTTSLAAYCFLPTDDPGIHTHTHTELQICPTAVGHVDALQPSNSSLCKTTGDRKRERADERQRKLEEKEILKRKHSFTQRSTFFYLLSSFLW